MDRDGDRSRSSPLSTFLKMADVLMLLPELMEDDVNVINDIRDLQILGRERLRVPNFLVEKH